jgi:hypothetical protein
MRLRILVLLLTSVIPGWLAAIVSGHFTLVDWKALDGAHRNYETLAKSGAAMRELSIAEAAEQRHRINCFADGVGVLLGGLIATVGIHGICTLPANQTVDKTPRDRVS